MLGVYLVLIADCVAESADGHGLRAGAGGGIGGSTGSVRVGQFPVVLGERGRPRAGRAVVDREDRLDGAASQHEVHPLPC